METIHFKPGAELTFKSVVAVRAKLSQLLKESSVGSLCLDLSEVIHCDSAGIALLIDTRKLGKKNNKHIKIMGMSLETLSLADFCGVKDILDTGEARWINY